MSGIQNFDEPIRDTFVQHLEVIFPHVSNDLWGLALKGFRVPDDGHTLPQEKHRTGIIMATTAS